MEGQRTVQVARVRRWVASKANAYKGQRVCNINIHRAHCAALLKLSCAFMHRARHQYMATLGCMDS